MLQTATFPQPISLWETANYPFYFELFGETRPLLDVKYAEVFPAGSIEDIPKNVTTVPIYQYWWTIGYGEGLDLSQKFPNQFAQGQNESDHGAGYPAWQF